MNALSTFRHKLGPSFMQLPPYFGSDRFDTLEHFFEAFPSDFDLSIELRHPSWFEDESIMKGCTSHESLRRLHYGSICRKCK